MSCVFAVDILPEVVSSIDIADGGISADALNKATASAALPIEFRNILKVLILLFGLEKSTRRTAIWLDPGCAKFFQLNLYFQVGQSLLGAFLSWIELIAHDGVLWFFEILHLRFVQFDTLIFAFLQATN